MDTGQETPEGDVISQAPEGKERTKGARRSKAYESLAAFLETYRKKSHLVLIQGTPDPDAISSALALELIGRQFDIDTTLLSFSAVSHHENRALLKRLNIPLVRYDDNFDLTAYSAYSIVDSQKAVTPINDRLESLDVEFLAFVDHHREDVSPPSAKFVDVRQYVASTAAIFCEYLQSVFPKGLEPSDPDHVRVATALMHGIRSDTNKFILATKHEYNSAKFLAPCVDHPLIELIERTILTPSMLQTLEHALVNLSIHDNFVFTDVGFVRSSDRDAIPQTADFLLNREGIDSVLIFGIVDEATIDGSFRTRSETINPDEFIKGFLGCSPESGQYYGGGNVKDRGGFQIPLGFLSIHNDKNQVYSMAREVIGASFLAHIGKTSKKASSASAPSA